MPVLVAAVLIAFIVSFQKEKPVKDLLERPSTYFTDETGARALLLVSQRVLPNVDVHQLPLDNLQADTLIVAGPKKELEDVEKEFLSGWLNDGGQLILASRDGWGGFLEKEYDVKVEAKSMTPQSWRIEKDLMVHMRGGVTWEGEFKPLARSGSEVLAISIPAGKGRIIAIGDPGVISNQALKEADNAVWLIGLMKGKVRFDEYHHGFGDRAGLLTNILRFLGTAWGLAFGQLALAGILSVTWMRSRLGRPVRRLDRHIQEPLLLMEARAGLFESARARHLALEQITGDLKHERLQELLQKKSLTSAELLEGAQLAAKIREEHPRVH